MRVVSFSALVLMIATACAPRHGGPVVNTTERKDRLLENLKAKYPQLGELNPTLSDVTRDEVSGLDQVTMVITTPRGPQNEKLLVTANDKALYIIMEGP